MSYNDDDDLWQGRRSGLCIPTSLYSTTNNESTFSTLSSIFQVGAVISYILAHRCYTSSFSPWLLLLLLQIFRLIQLSWLPTKAPRMNLCELLCDCLLITAMGLSCKYSCFLAVSLFTTHTSRMVLFSVVSVCLCLSVCLSVNMITAEPFEISSRNFQGIILS